LSSWPVSRPGCRKSDSSLWGTGYDFYGQLGDGFGSNSSLPKQIIPLPQPMLTARVASGTSLQFTATCQFAGTFYLLASTDITQPLSQWARVWTNSVNANSIDNFSATLATALSSSAKGQFYILQSQ